MIDMMIDIMMIGIDLASASPKPKIEISQRPSLLDLRGSIPVSEPQNFKAIRHQVMKAQVQQVMASTNDLIRLP